ncbi:Acetyltransferase (GNAT) family [Legionella lansingensis]|uniref:Mycothiol acetyltransferase n=1 Tax=Legionella lansingensis TaxID=45067 RepID=A0A0W0VW71_9GAMM|nr:GNAT family N-acetyltransferase [Legionella lansingensis]KTD24323.1 Mycothiol acetyltransferase [Legionella lansingensis]SNV51799.1 Acetyltransferase (GNAT) family [Legionella lansingensis]
MTPKEFFKKLARRAIWAIKGPPVTPALLEMVWPETLESPSGIQVPEEYRLRQFRSDDTQSYLKLFIAAGMEEPPLHYWDKHLLPEGFFVIEHEPSNAIVAACFASHHPTPRHPRAGNFGWLAVDPTHRGRKLGQAVAAAVTSRLVAGGYRRIYLETHDHRLPAIAIYLKMGWVPLLYLPEMEARWAAVCKVLKWPYTPESWPR